MRLRCIFCHTKYLPFSHVMDKLHDAGWEESGDPLAAFGKEMSRAICLELVPNSVPHLMTSRAMIGPDKLF